ncbi:hypothetical protein EST38_g10552 [Candolleomyces aberdarensis]|uniref:Uncharacterized protein n=1 Tax=Candolleomyces aberdarensis TaxID=2316362 RepID=A0A4Q2D9B7_9AGAR|nr:hypothetical protein EST38_g10552 [Candolleomyces aberdarensis]
MSVANCTQSIDPNPDISGIGVRVAIYAQAILTLVQPVLAALDKYISEEELASLHILYLGILIPGCALLLSAVIQTSRDGLSVYHAIIVLNLSWINNTSALIFFQFALTADMKLKKGREFRGKVGELLDFLVKSLAPGRRTDFAVQRAAEKARRLRIALKTALKNHEDMTQEKKRLKEEGIRNELADLDRDRIGAEVEGSRDILQDVIQGLTALTVAAESRDGGEELRDAVNAMTERLQDARFGRALGREEPGSTRRYWIGRWAWWNQIPGGPDLVYLLERDSAMALVTTFHLTFFSAFGTWFWFTIAQRNDYCDQLTTHGIIFVSIPITSKALRIASIVLYIICTIPFLNVLIFGCLELIVVYVICLIRWWLRRCRGRELRPPPLRPGVLLADSSGRTGLYSFIGLTLVLQIYFIVSNELSIRFNAHLLKREDEGANEEAEWTFGQTLAIALIIVPLIQVWKDLRKPGNREVFKRWSEKLSWRFERGDTTPESSRSSMSFSSSV